MQNNSFIHPVTALIQNAFQPGEVVRGPTESPGSRIFRMISRFRMMAQIR